MGGAGPTVLLGWELGCGLGHVQQLPRLAHAPAARGFPPVLGGGRRPSSWSLRPVGGHRRALGIVEANSGVQVNDAI